MSEYTILWDLYTSCRAAFYAQRERIAELEAQLAAELDKTNQLIQQIISGRVSPCGQCGGEGVIDSGGSSPCGKWIEITCPNCNGIGIVTEPESNKSATGTV